MHDHGDDHDHAHDHHGGHDHDGHGHHHHHHHHAHMAGAGALPLSRRALIGSVAALGASAALPGMAWATVPAVAADMAKAVGAWLAALSPALRRKAVLGWSSRRRGDWHYIPRGRPGVTLKEMGAAQTKALWDVLATLLSRRGVQQIEGIIKLERVLGELTDNLEFRDPANYALAVFGNPAGAAPWAWRFEGHHLSVSVMVAPGHGVGVTPAFFGANPAKVPSRHRHAGFRLLGAEEDAVFSLVGSLDGALRAAAVIGERSLGDIVAGPGREDELKRYQGVALARLNEAQTAGVMRILELFTGTLRPELASAAMARVTEAGVGALHFAWAGSPTRGRPHYFRVHGPKTLVEYDNTQDGANHVHSVWIDPEGAFGRDLLKKHYRDAH
ncbi:MAG: DUF3500 domain-containing protein [Hyphomicrobiaceae bacterium]